MLSDSVGGPRAINGWKNTVLLDILVEEMVAKFDLEFIVLHCITEDANLFDSLTTSLAKKNSLLPSCMCLHLSFTPLLLVLDELQLRTALCASILVKPLDILKLSVSLRWSQCFSTETRYRFVNLSSLNLICRDVIIFIHSKK